jgi:hypothetical protein
MVLFVEFTYDTSSIHADLRRCTPFVQTDALYALHHPPQYITHTCTHAHTCVYPPVVPLSVLPARASFILRLSFIIHLVYGVCIYILIYTYFFTYAIFCSIFLINLPFYCYVLCLFILDNCPCSEFKMTWYQ